MDGNSKEKTKMRTILTVIACSTIFSAFALAADWSGTLLDETCYNRQYQQLKDVQRSADTCAATSETTSFALNSAGKVLKFDSNGNTKAMSALKNRADRLAPGTKTTTAQIQAKVAGTESGDMIKVDSVDVQ
jgi:hypothetical protein